MSRRTRHAHVYSRGLLMRTFAISIAKLSLVQSAITVTQTSACSSSPRVGDARSYGHTVGTQHRATIALGSWPIFLCHTPCLYFLCGSTCGNFLGMRGRCGSSGMLGEQPSPISHTRVLQQGSIHPDGTPQMTLLCFDDPRVLVSSCFWRPAVAICHNQGQKFSAQLLRSCLSLSNFGRIFCCTTYLVQEKYTPTVYMHTQMDINCKMRAILVDWIVEVHLKFKLADPTLYLTCHIIDRFCMLENVHRSKLQLVGVTALLIACKYEEIFPIVVRDCVYITDQAYTREEVLEMEQMILRRLKFEITVPTSWTFLVRFLKVAKATDRQHHRAQYYLERSLQEHDGLSFRPSMLAATSLFLARIPDVGLDSAWVSKLVLSW